LPVKFAEHLQYTLVRQILFREVTPLVTPHKHVAKISPLLVPITGLCKMNDGATGKIAEIIEEKTRCKLLQENEPDCHFNFSSRIQFCRNLLPPNLRFANSGSFRRKGVFLYPFPSKKIFTRYTGTAHENRFLCQRTAQFIPLLNHRVQYNYRFTISRPIFNV
jgi:hypothetical protein